VHDWLIAAGIRPVKLLGVRPVKVLSFGRGPFTQTRYRFTT
jgi:hypothetical protein